MRNELDNDQISDFTAGLFLKEEFYTKQNKFPRTIAALSDQCKAFFGPIFHAVDELTYSHGDQSRCFVKKIPVVERPAHVEALFGNNPVNVGDFTSFECCHRGVVSQAVFYLVQHMLGSVLPPEVMNKLKQLFTGFNVLHHKATGIRAQVSETLMSGAPWTAWANLIACLFIISWLRLAAAHPSVPPQDLWAHFSEFKGLVEGDDSITLGGEYDKQLIAGLGLPLKSVCFQNYSKGSFCGIVKPLNDDTIVGNPIQVVCVFFCLKRDLMNCSLSKERSYLRAKALSYFHQYEHCPIIGPMAHAVLERTRSYTPDSSRLDYWRKAVFDSIDFKQKRWLIPYDVNSITHDARNLVFELYGIDVDEQMQLEKSFLDWGRGCDVVFSFPPCFDEYIHNSILNVDSSPDRPIPVWNNPHLMDPEQFKDKWIVAANLQELSSSKIKLRRHKPIFNTADIS